MRWLPLLFKIWLALVLLVVVVFFVLGKWSQSGQAKGLQAGKLAACGDRPNCVTTETEGAQNTAQALPPLSVHKPWSPALQQQLIAIVQAQGGSLAQKDTHYLGFQFRSKLFGFVDDLELRMDETTRQLHVRSASRVGYSDRGVNRARVLKLYEALRPLLQDR